MITSRTIFTKTKNYISTESTSKRLGCFFKNIMCIVTDILLNKELLCNVMTWSRNEQGFNLSCFQTGYPLKI